MGPTVVRNGWTRLWVEKSSEMLQVGHDIAWAEATSRDLMLGSGMFDPGSNSGRPEESLFRHPSPILRWVSSLITTWVCRTAGKGPGEAKAERTSVTRPLACCKPCRRTNCHGPGQPLWWQAVPFTHILLLSAFSVLDS